jgi:post-segregation antitoxin (ccd killing protein)
VLCCLSLPSVQQLRAAGLDVSGATGQALQEQYEGTAMQVCGERF